MSAKDREAPLVRLSEVLREALADAEQAVAEDSDDRYAQGRRGAFHHAVEMFDIMTGGDFKPASAEAGAR